MVNSHNMMHDSKKLFGRYPLLTTHIISVIYPSDGKKKKRWNALLILAGFEWLTTHIVEANAWNKTNLAICHCFINAKFEPKTRLKKPKESYYLQVSNLVHTASMLVGILVASNTLRVGHNRGRCLHACNIPSL